MFYLIATPLAFAPSLIWLFYYFRKDIHPEPKRLIAKTFIWSMTATLLAALAIFIGVRINEQLLALGIDLWIALPPILVLPLAVIFFNAFWEEMLKYLVVRFGVFQNKEFDEPVDAMVYLIVAGLGFAAVENVIISSQFECLKSLSAILFVRFLGATLIHALCSGVLGYFLARAVFWQKSRRRFPLRLAYVLGGIVVASCLHGLFNFLIIKSEQFQNTSLYFYLLAIFILALAILVIHLFQTLNRQSLKKS